MVELDTEDESNSRDEADATNEPADHGVSEFESVSSVESDSDDDEQERPANLRRASGCTGDWTRELETVWCERMRADKG